jgi:hypothetical protein
VKEQREKPSIHTEKSKEVARCSAEPKRLSRFTVASYAALKALSFLLLFSLSFGKEKR